MTDTQTSPATTREFEGVTIPSAGTFGFDLSHSAVSFTARHLMVSKVRGKFTEFDGTLTIAEDPLESSVEVEIDAASVDTGEPKRDEHLRSTDFFGAESHKHITFKSTGVRHVEGDRFTVTGDLTVRGVTRPVELDLEVLGVLVDPWGSQRIGFSARTEIDREDFGLTWNQALEGGGVLVGKKITIEIDTEAVRQG
jgi:polyisoprenoid-binding protein YceI